MATGEATPKALRNTAQGCRAAATLGTRTDSSSYPEGVAQAAGSWAIEPAGRNPIGVENRSGDSAQGSRENMRQPWAMMRKAFGVESNHHDSASRGCVIRLTPIGQRPGDR